ncbi:hypothetical protein BJY59DRAFT_149983 [Rhodotorula toruloides]
MELVTASPTSTAREKTSSLIRWPAIQSSGSRRRCEEKSLLLRWTKPPLVLSTLTSATSCKGALLVTSFARKLIRPSTLTFAALVPSRLLSPLVTRATGSQQTRRSCTHSSKGGRRHVTLEASDLARLPLSLSLAPSPHSDSSLLLFSPSFESKSLLPSSTSPRPSTRPATPPRHRNSTVLKDLVEEALVRCGSRATCELAARLLRLSFDGVRTDRGGLWATADLPRSLPRSLRRPPSTCSSRANINTLLGSTTPPNPLYLFSRTSRVLVFMDDLARILRCHAPTAVHWRSHRTLSYSVRAVVDAFEQGR